MSTNSTSPTIHSSSSRACGDDSYDIPSSPVRNESDEIVYRTYFGDDPGFEECERNSLWHDLDRDGVNAPAIPSFILNSPPMGPVSGVGREYEDTMFPEGLHSEVSLHSLRKGASRFAIGLMVGYDPKFFFGETVDRRSVNVEASGFIPDVDRDPVSPIGSQYPSRAYCSNTPSPSTSARVNENPLWSTGDVSSFKYIPSQGPWGVIPSRTIMITNLPKTTQLWTLVELLKVTPCTFRS